jgi:hypothetical protein
VKIASLPVSWFGITPLYDFNCDADDLCLDEAFHLKKYEAFMAKPFLMSNDAFLRSSSAIVPDYVLWQEPTLNPQTVKSLLDYVELSGGHYLSPAAHEVIYSTFFAPAILLFRVLRLFKAGRLRGGDTYVILRIQDKSQEKWESVTSHRCTRMTIDPFIPMKHQGIFSLNSAELPIFNALRDCLRTILESANKKQTSILASLELAFDLYAREEFEDIEIVNALTALEALLLNDSKTELTYRLSMRVAHLLGADAPSRRQLFEDMKDFYDVRSAVVHGSQIKPKHQTRMEQSDILREIVRKTLLTVLPLVAAGMARPQLDLLLDEVVLDENVRLSVQKTAAKFLLTGPPSPATVQ